MVARAKKIQARWWQAIDGFVTGNPRRPPDELHQAAVRLADNLAWCSCYSCGNPRRHFGFTVHSIRHEALTRQERRHLLDFHEQTGYIEKS